MKRGLTPAFFLLAVLLAALWGSFKPFLRSDQPAIFQGKELRQAPSFSLPLMPEGKVQLSLDEWRSGKPLLLIFWATWCPPCLQEIPVLEQWHKEYSDRFNILAVHVGQPHEPLNEFMPRMGISYPVVLDLESRAASLYGVSGLPVAVVLDPEGKILYYGFTLPGQSDILAAGSGV